MKPNEFGSMVRRMAQALLSAALTMCAALVLCIVLVQFAPGFASDIRELDPRLNAESVRALREQRGSGGVWTTVHDLGVRAIAGDLGTSQTFGRPVVAVLSERARTTAVPLVVGISAGWLLAIVVSLLNRVWHSALSGISRGASSSMLCLPAPVIGLALMTRSAAPELAPFWVGCVVALLVFPRVLLAADQIFREANRSPHAEYARAYGVSQGRILLAHVIWPSTPALLAVAGSSVAIAVGGMMPVEVVCDSPGLGQLAWLATEQRDLPVLLAVTLLVTLVALSASLAGDVGRAFPALNARQA